jgi:phosphoserine phosphatase
MMYIGESVMENYVTTLIASPRGPDLQESMLRELVPDARIDWLAPARACDVFTRMCPAFPPLEGVDAITQPAASRTKKLLISDMDSTMITVECIDELADFVGKKAEVSHITERAMNGELDFAAALTERVALLAGLPESVLQECYDSRVKMMPGAKTLVSAMRAAGAHCVLVSGGFTFFTARVAAELGFHEDYSNTLEIAHGKLTGRVRPPILGKEAKLATLQAACTARGIGAEEVLAIGDGANDLPMLLAAGLGVAYHAKPSVQAQAHAHINHNDLSALLYAQGLPA